MNVVFYTDSDYYSGAEKVLLSVCAGVKAKTKTLVLNPAIQEKISRGSYQDLVINWAATRSKLAFWQFLAYRRLIRRAGATVCVVNMQTPYANTWFLLAARSLGQTIVTIWHFPQEKKDVTGPLRFLKLRAYRWAIDCSDTIVAVSDWHRRVLVEEFGAPAPKTRTIRNGITDPGVPAHRSAHQPLRFLTVGTLEPRKGQHWLVETLAKLAGDWQLTLVGDGPDRALIAALVKQLGLGSKVTLVGYQSDVRALYRDHDLLLHPALAENLSLVIIEALAAGLPVAANAVGGNGELVVDRQSGYLLPPLDRAAWQRALLATVQDPAIIQTMSRHARQVFTTNFTEAVMIRGYQQLLDELVS